MSDLPRAIERLSVPARDADLRGLASLLVDAVDSGAAVSFVAPLTMERAEAWWRSALAAADPRAVVLVARDAEGIVGTVQLQPAWAPNQPHRAEVVKLLVHRRSRRAGLGARLMRAIEDAAREAGFTLLTLDAKSGGAAEALYRHGGWIPVGVIPRYAVDPDGPLHDAIFFYKDLNPTMTTPVWPWPASLDALIAAPRHHALVFENEKVRVLDTRIPPGETAPLHTHRWPSVWHVLGWSDCVRRDAAGIVLVDTREAKPDVEPGTVQWSEPLPPHTLENVGPVELRVISVELKDGGGRPGAQPA